MVIKMLGTVPLVVAVSVGLYLLGKGTSFGRKKYAFRQLVYGVVFGLVSVSSTEVFGIPINGAIANVRDAAPICAGLLFGGPAGVIAGIIGGVERWFSIYWGGGTFSRLACSLSTVLAGIIAALLRKYMLDNKKSTWLFALSVGLTVEVLHMLMLFVFRMDNVQAGFRVLSSVGVPMIAINGLAVMLSVFAVSILSDENILRHVEHKQISQTVQSWLFICVTAAFLVTCVFIYALQTNLAESDARALLELSINDVKETVQEVSDMNMLNLTESIAEQLKDGYDDAILNELVNQFRVTEINISNESGIVIASSVPEYLGFDFARGEQAAEFLVLLGEQNSYVQSFQPITDNPSLSKKYAGVALPDGGFVQIGYDAEHFQQDINNTIVAIAHNWHVGQTGSIIVADEDGIIVSDDNNHANDSLVAVGILPDNVFVGNMFISNVYGEKCVCMMSSTEGYYIISFMSESEVYYLRNVSVYITALIEVIILSVVFILIYMLIKLVVVNNIRKINTALSKITEGRLDLTVDVRSNEEFVSLSNDINMTVDTLKRYIDEAEKRLDAELALAKNIQASMLPSADGAFSDRDEFSIYASMTPAKEVGGDFYDFFLVDDDRMALVIADVSGKGIPAALFMVRAMTMIKNTAQAGFSPKVVLEKVNNQLCEGNEAEMFVTVWLGILEISTGKLTAANAGHEYPAIMRENGDFELLRDKHGFVLAGMEGSRYKEYEMLLNQGDKLFVYTDGVTEATDVENHLYGTGRMIDALNAVKSEGCEKILHNLKNDIDGFVKTAPQFDDITMLCIEMKKQNIKELIIASNHDRTDEVTTFVESTFANCNVPMKIIAKMNIAVDEIFSNIAHYSGATTTTVRCGILGDAAILIFCDDGLPYDPTQKTDPDITLSAEEREIGGLGLYMVKKTMDSVEYAYQDGHNILTLKKKFQ